MRHNDNELKEKIQIREMGEVCEVKMQQNTFGTKANFEHGIQVAHTMAQSGKFKSVILIFEGGEIVISMGQSIDEIRAAISNVKLGKTSDIFKDGAEHEYLRSCEFMRSIGAD